MTQGIDRIPDSLGYLVLTDDGAVMSSGGELENNEQMANKITKLIYTTCGVISPKVPFKRLSVIWDDIMYAITVSNHKIFISKRRYVPQDPAVA
ncbi:hypothetical protein ScPMuIL_018352 [Solemya velum]